jgi:4-hydroxy-3-methylbut-2-en-1-yl diphosphate reductase
MGICDLNTLIDLICAFDYFVLEIGSASSPKSKENGLKIFLANPRGFCAGVDRAIKIVNLSLKTYGAPIYVRHEIVHSRHVVESLREKGAIFVGELNEVPDGAIVIFSAHGVAKGVWEESTRRNLKVIDATCPLVIKVHNEVNRDYSNDYELILIGHAGHPEVVGTLGQVPDKLHLISSVKDVDFLEVENPLHVSYVTQTTLSVDDCREIVEALHRRFPGIKGPHQEDICYATQNRQNAVKELSHFVDVILVVGSPHSSNSNRLRELGERREIPSYLIDSYQDIQTEWLEGVQAIGITAGASAPEVLVTQVINFLKEHGAETVEELTIVKENIEFLLPKELLMGKGKR